MKISVKRSGGFAGLTEEFAVDSATLPPDTAQQVVQLVQRRGFFALPAFLSGTTIGADLFRYEITVTEDDRQHTVAFEDDNSPETAPLRQLVATLQQMT